MKYNLFFENLGMAIFSEYAFMELWMCSRKLLTIEIAAFCVW
jgi:hypothetical protein